MKYKRKVTTVDAVQWKKKGDHKDVALLSGASPGFCKRCGKAKNKHGYLSGVGKVCPGSWIVECVPDEYVIMTDATFKRDYVKA